MHSDERIGLAGALYDLGLEVGAVAVAVIKSTDVVVELPGHERAASDV